MAKTAANGPFANGSGEDGPVRSAGARQLWRYGSVWVAPAVLWVLVVIALREPLTTWLKGQNAYDQAALEEWLKEARGFRQTLPEMIEDYLQRASRLADL